MAVNVSKQSMDTPVWNLGDTDNVYEPAEDSFLLLDALESDLKSLCGLHPSVILEVGSGSGVIITALSKALGNSVLCIATDINPDACATTCRTSSKNDAQVEVLRTDLVGGLRLSGMVDVALFNPPYVVTEDKEITGTLQRAWAGGCDGRIVMDRLFPLLPELLSPKGVFYLVVIEENKPLEIAEVMKKLNFTAETIARRKVRGEHLSIMKFERSCRN